MESQHGNFDPSTESRLEGPYFSTSGWERDFSGAHPVEMLARIARYENKREAKFEPYKKPFNTKGNSDFNKIVSCSYDGIEAFGNGKLEKQAKLVATRNMICKLKQINIGIVNETIAAGVKTDYNPHKKPIVQKFKMFKSAGTLSSSFVPASKDESNPFGSSTSFALDNNKVEADKEIDQYKAYIEGKIADPSEELIIEPVIATTETKPVTKPKIVFKRPYCDPSSNDEPSIKKTKSENIPSEDSTEGAEYWNPDNYGYENNHYGYNWKGRGNNGGGGKGAFQRGGGRGGRGSWA